MMTKKILPLSMLAKTVVFIALSIIPSMADAIYCMPRAAADSVREKLKVGQRMMYFCDPRSQLYFNLEDAFRLESFSTGNSCSRRSDDVEIIINQQLLPLQCLYLENEGLFSYFLNLYDNPHAQKTPYIPFFDTLGRALEKKDGALRPFDWRARYLKRKIFDGSTLGQVGAYYSQEKKIKKVRLLRETREYFSQDSAILKVEAIQKATFFGDSAWTTGNLRNVVRECRKASRFDPFLACDRECLYVAEYELEKPLRNGGSLVYGQFEIKQFNPSGEIKTFAPKNILNHIKAHQPVPFLNQEGVALGKAVETTWFQRGDSIFYSETPDSNTAPDVINILNLKSIHFKCYSYGEFLVLQDNSVRGFVTHVFYQGSLILSHGSGDSPFEMGKVITYKNKVDDSLNLLFSFSPYYIQTYTILMTRRGTSWTLQKSMAVDFGCNPC